MRLAAGAHDIQRTAALLGTGVVYTSKGVTADSSGHETDTAAQDSSNAAV